MNRKGKGETGITLSKGSQLSWKELQSSDMHFHCQLCHQIVENDIWRRSVLIVEISNAALQAAYSDAFVLTILSL